MMDITDLPPDHPISKAWGRLMNKEYEKYVTDFYDPDKVEGSGKIFPMTVFTPEMFGAISDEDIHKQSALYQWAKRKTENR
jgi:hypothetical protein